MSKRLLVVPEFVSSRAFENAMAAGAGASEKASPKCVSPMAPSEKLNYIGMRHPVFGKREFKIKRYLD